VDVLCAFAVGIVGLFIAIFVLAVRRQPGDPALWIQAMSGLSAGGLLVSFLGNTLYHAISECIGGASVGKLVCGLRVVSEDFTPVSFRGALIRSAVFPLDAVFFGLIAYRSMKRSSLAQRVGDHWGGTAVVSRRNFPAAARGPARVLLGLSLSLAAWVVVQVISLVAAVINAA
jgi:uncharacterized RDD family membrane protein YckC